MSARMLAAAARRLLQAVLVVLVAATIAFLLLHLAPGDPIAATLDGPTVAESVRQHWRAVYGLDRPLGEQYVRWLAATLRGDLGWSLANNAPVSRVLADALPNTLFLVGTALVVAFGLGIGVGSAQAAMHVRGTRGTRLVDRVIGTITVVCFSIPEYWLALAMLVLLTFVFPIFPTSGTVDVTMHDIMTPLDRLRDRAWHVVLPAATLALGLFAVVARHQRAALLDVAREDFLRTARAKGAGERRILFRHALRNALLPIVTLLGLAIPALVGGVVFVETVFSWPGMGRVAVAAVNARDYALVTGTVIVGSAAVTVGALLAELLHATLDPRVRDGADDVGGRAIERVPA